MELIALPLRSYALDSFSNLLLYCNPCYKTTYLSIHCADKIKPFKFILRSFVYFYPESNIKVGVRYLRLYTLHEMSLYLPYSSPRHVLAQCCSAIKQFNSVPPLLPHPPPRPTNHSPKPSPIPEPIAGPGLNDFLKIKRPIKKVKYPLNHAHP